MEIRREKYSTNDVLDATGFITLLISAWIVANALEALLT